MLKTLRTNTKWIIIIVAVCFIGMIIFAWGMDITGRRSSVSTVIVGKINGEEILYADYDRFVKSQRQTYSRNTRMTFEDERRIHNEVWDYIVTQKIIEQDIKKRNISYTDRELFNFMLDNPPQWIYQEPSFQENDRFSLRKYQAFLKNPDNLKDPQMKQVLLYIEAEASGRLPAIKFQQSLTDAVNLTNSQVRDLWLRDNEKRKAEWVFLSVNNISDVDRNVEPEEIRMYYEEHKEDFKLGERRTLHAVFFELSPTAEDSSEVLEQAKLLVERARRGEEFSELANEYSDDPGNISPAGERRGGDLGFFGKDRMIPDFEKAAFNLQPGEVSDPVITQFGCHVIKVDSIKYKDDEIKEIDQVKARHILMNIEPSVRTRDAVESEVKSFYESVIGGMDFMLQAQLDSLNVTHTRPFQKDASVIQGIRGNIQLLVNRTFKAKKDDVLPIYFTDSGYFVMRVALVFEAGSPVFEEVRPEIENIVRREVRARYAEDFINRVHASMQEGQSLKEAVEADSVKVANVTTGEVFRNYFIPGLGSMNPFMARIFSLENPGDTTGPVITEYGSGIAVLLEKLPIDEEQYERERIGLKNRTESELKNEIVSRYIESLREKAEIVDDRDMFSGL